MHRAPDARRLCTSACGQVPYATPSTQPLCAVRLPPTPAPTQTPAPGISFTAGAERVLQGNPVIFTWDVQGAQEVYFYQAGQDWQNRRGGRNYAVAIVQVVEPAATMQAKATPTTGPAIDLFSVLPGRLAVGKCVELRWTVGGKTTNIRIERAGTVVVEGAHAAAAASIVPARPDPCAAASRRSTNRGKRTAPMPR